MRKFEYRILEMTLGEKDYGAKVLNEYGADGWELVGLAGEDMLGSTSTHLLFLKRETAGEDTDCSI